VKEHLIALAQAADTPQQAQNVVREYLQARILGSLQRAGAMVPLAFHGGTALRFLYGSARYSEDLDFALEQARALYDFRAYLRLVQSDFRAEGYDVMVRVNDRKVVHSAFVRFGGLLYEMGLSAQRTQALSVKIEVDTNPPSGAGLESTIVRSHLTLRLQHHDRASLLAGKLHAILQRPYLKGRDIYDLLWYLSDPQWPDPNLDLLNNALQQTGWSAGQVTPENWPDMVRHRLQGLRWNQVVGDVRPFLEPSFDVTLLTLDNVLRVLDQVSSRQAKVPTGATDWRTT